MTYINGWFDFANDDIEGAEILLKGEKYKKEFVKLEFNLLIGSI